MSIFHSFKLCCTSFLLFLSFGLVSVYADSQVPTALKDVGITEKLGVSIPLDAIFQDETGAEVRLSKYFLGKNPVILNLVYFDCPMLCNLVLTGFVEGLKKMPFQMGKDFEVISLSINPNDTPETALRYKAKYLDILKQPDAGKGWHFLVGKEEPIRKVADSVGFLYRFDPSTKEYSHAAAQFFLSPEGKTARYLYGIDYKPFDLRMAVIEAKERKQISTVERALLFCYNYDVHTRGYGLYATRIMRVGAGLTLIILLGFLYKQIKRKKKQ